MIGKVGDTIVIESERADVTGRRGVIEEVVQQQPPRRGDRLGRDDEREVGAPRLDVFENSVDVFYPRDDARGRQGPQLQSHGRARYRATTARAHSVLAHYALTPLRADLATLANFLERQAVNAGIDRSKRHNMADDIDANLRQG